jgi:hypothetical protein
MTSAPMARSVQDFCRAYGIGRTATYDLINDGTLVAKKFGKRTLIMEESAQAWFHSLALIPTPALSEQSRTMANGGTGKGL